MEQPVLPQFMSNGPQQVYINRTTKQQDVSLLQTAYVHSLILPQGRNIFTQTMSVS